MKNIQLVIAGLIFWIGFSPCISFGTEPCPPNPCRSSTGQFVEESCRDASDWIAVGSISEVERDVQGQPLNKDFAAFVFTPETWEKGSPLGIKSFRFKVGWCENSTEVPEDYSGKFKFYGISSTSESNQYLDFRLTR